MIKKIVKIFFNKLGFTINRIMPPVKDYSKSTLFEDFKGLLLDKGQPVIFDVGANIGQSIEEFKDNFPESVIYSFEPSKSTFLELKKNNGDRPGVHLENMALASSAGQKEFQENESSEMSSFLEFNQTEWGRFKEKSMVQTGTLDEYCATKGIKKIDILKIDTQGYELEVFKGSLRMMKENNIQLLFFEMIFSDMYKNLPSFGEIHELLTAHDYKIVKFYESHCVNGLLSWIDILYVNLNYTKN